jgi:PEGA domain-containing protein
MKDEPRKKMRRSRKSWLTVIVLLAGCATAWQDSGSFYRSAQTALTVETVPAGARAFLNNRYLGDTPLSAPLECEQEMRMKTRKVSYWDTQPALALLLSITSLGLYIPFSLIPADTETALEPTGVFRSNEFIVRVEADGHKPWGTTITCGPQPAVSVHAVLEKL